MVWVKFSTRILFACCQKDNSSKEENASDTEDSENNDVHYNIQNVESIGKDHSNKTTVVFNHRDVHNHVKCHQGSTRVCFC